MRATPLQCLAVGLATLAAAENWTVLSPSGTPPEAREGHVAFFDSAAGTMFVFGGVSASNVILGDLHSYELQTNAWSALSPSGSSPSPRRFATAVMDSVSNTMLLFGGRDSSGSDLSDLHRYDVQANAWSPLSPSGSVPPARYRHSAVFDAASRTMVIFGGWWDSSRRNDLHSYDTQANAWSVLSPTNSAPVARHWHTAVLDTTSQTMLVFGGSGDDDMLNDLHGYDVQANAWSELSPSGSAPSARRGHSAVWDSAARVMLVFGGMDGSRLNDLHSYDTQANSWSALSAAGTLPSARRYISAALDPASRTVLIFGGDDGSIVNDLYSLQPPTMTTSTIAATTSTATVTEKQCDPGLAISGDERCEACAPGKFGAGGRQACVACASGHDSESGSPACQPTVGHVMANLTEPALTTSRVSPAVVKLDVTMAALPQEVFDVQALSYAIDIAPTADGLSAESACAARWQVSEDAASVQLTLAEFSDPCSTNVSNTGSGIRLDGVLGVHLLAEVNGSTEVTFMWLRDLTLTFDAHTDASQGGIVVVGFVTLGAQTFHLGAFTSTLKLFVSSDFTTVKHLPILRDNDLVHVQHALDDKGVGLKMELVMVWLSTSSNVSDLDAVEHNLTSVLVHHDGGSPGSLRYSFLARPCQRCHLHSLARVSYSVDGRRLESLESFTVQSLYLEVGVNAPEELPELPYIIMGPAIALTVSAIVAAVTGIIVGLLGRFLKRPTFGTASVRVFMVLEACDCLSDVLALVLAHAEGDLKFSNDAGAVPAALSACVGLSVALFFMEACFWARFRQRFSQAQKKRIHNALTCIHLAMQDSFQVWVYGFIAASQARTGLGISGSVLVGVIQAVAFTMAKTAEVAGALDLCCDGDGEAHRPAARLE